jgi:hypothetical protein
MQPQSSNLLGFDGNSALDAVKAAFKVDLRTELQAGTI